ncbi:hypothetical protein Hanom_Chr15g01399101 [Helianthus anomalus]
MLMLTFVNHQIKYCFKMLFLVKSASTCLLGWNGTETIQIPIGVTQMCTWVAHETHFFIKCIIL